MASLTPCGNYRTSFCCRVPHNRLHVPSGGNQNPQITETKSSVTGFSVRTQGQEAVQNAWQRPGAAPGTEHKQFQQPGTPGKKTEETSGPLHDIDWSWSVLDALRGALGRGESPYAAPPSGSPARVALRAARDDGAPFGATVAVQDEDIEAAFHADTASSKAVSVLLGAGAARDEAALCDALSSASPPPSAQLALRAKEAWRKYFVDEGKHQVAVRDSLFHLQSARNTAAAAEEEWAFLHAMAEREQQALPTHNPAPQPGKNLHGAMFRGFENDDGEFFLGGAAPLAASAKGDGGRVSAKQVRAAATAAAAASSDELKALQSVADLAAGAPSLGAPPGTLTGDGGVAWGHGPVLVLGSGLGHTSVRLAEALRNTTVLSVAWPSASAPGSASGALQSPAQLHGRLKRLRGVRNNPTVQAGVHGSTLATLHAAHVPWGAVLLDDLQRMTGSLLHDEFTELLGSILALSRRTVLLQGTLPDTRFFSYWNSLEDLVAEAAASADLSVSFSVRAEQAVGWGATPRKVALVAVQTRDEAAAEKHALEVLAASASKAARDAEAAAARKRKASSKLPLGGGLASDDTEDEPLSKEAEVPALPSNCLSIDVAAELRGLGLPVAPRSAAVFRSHLPHVHHTHVPGVVAALLDPPQPKRKPNVNHPWEEEKPSMFQHAAGAGDSSLLPAAPPAEWLDLAPGTRADLQTRAVIGWADGVPLSLLHALQLQPADLQHVMTAVALPWGAPGVAFHPPGTPPSHLLWAGENILHIPPAVNAPPAVPRRVSEHASVQPVLPSPTQAAPPQPASAVNVPAVDSQTKTKSVPSSSPTRQQPKLPLSGASLDRPAVPGPGTSADRLAGKAGASKAPGATTPGSKTENDKTLHPSPAPGTKQSAGKPAEADPAPAIAGEAASSQRAGQAGALRGKGAGAGRRHLSLPDSTALMRGTVLSGGAGAAADASGAVLPAEVLRAVAAATRQQAAGAVADGSAAAALGEILPPAYFAAAAVAAADSSLAEVQPVGVGPAEAAADAAWAHRARHSVEGSARHSVAGSSSAVPPPSHGALLRAAWGWLRHELGQVAVADSDSTAAPRAHASVLVSGSSAGALSSKLARAFPGSLVLAALGSTPQAEAQAMLSDMLGQSNMMVLQGAVDGAAASNVAALGDPLTAHVTDAAPLLAAVQRSGAPGAAVDALGGLLKMAATTLLVLPPWPVLLHAMSFGVVDEGGSPGSPPRGQHPPCDTHASRNPAALLEALGVYGAQHAHSQAEDQPGESTPGVVAEDAFGYTLPPEAAAALKAFNKRFGGGGMQEVWKPTVAHIVSAYAGRPSGASRAQCDLAAGQPCACVGGLLSEGPYRQLARAAAQQAGIMSPHVTVHTVDLPGSTPGCPQHLLALRVDTGEWAAGAGGAPQPQPLPAMAAADASSTPSFASRGGVSVFTLTSLQASPAVRRDMLRLFLSLPLPRIARALGKADAAATLPPWNVRIFLGGDGALRMAAGVPRASGGARWFQAARGAGLKAAQTAASDAWSAMQGVLSEADTSSGGAPSTFSYLELGSGLGASALPVAAAHPHATVVSIEDSRLGSDVQLAASLAFGLNNALVCRHSVDGRLVRDLAASPEFFRFVHLAPALTELLAEQGRSEVSELVTGALQAGATSMLHIPGAELLSLAMASVFAEPAPPAVHAFRLAAHPTRQWAAAEWRLITELVKPPPTYEFSVRVRVLPSGPDVGSGGYGVRSPRAWGRLPQGTLSSGMVRVDITNMTRPVNHHFQSEIDGHDRKYTLHVAANGSLADSAGAAVAALGNHPNDGGRISVQLIRSKDKAGIPYTTLHGVTLIALLRLGLLAPLRARAYHQFVALPLYQDMAPWNIVFLGDALDYIDFDTRDRTFDNVVPAAFEVMEVLFNYKRTVEDFKRCGSKAPNLYNFPFLSDCVGSEAFRGPCPETGKHVPCGDGQCHSDYISCLRAVSGRDMAAGKAGWGHSVASTRLQLVESAASALKQDSASALAAAAVGGDAPPAPPSATAASAAREGQQRSADLGHGELRFQKGKYAM